MNKIIAVVKYLNEMSKYYLKLNKMCGYKMKKKKNSKKRQTEKKQKQKLWLNKIFTK